MINLLPDDIKQQIRAARTNTYLIKYIFFLIISVVFLGLACSTSYLFLSTSKTSAEQTIAIDQTKSNSYSSVISQANAISTSLSTANSILDQQISYSDIIMGIAAALPNGVVLDALSLSDSTLGAPIVMTAHARTTDAATALKANFQKSPLFSNYSLQSLSSSTGSIPGYPIGITISITINKNVSL
jgi:Tfp pilus assembly protein PilN